VKWFGGSPLLLFLLVGLAAVLGVGVAFGNVYAVAVIPAALLVVVSVVWPREVLVFMLAYIPLEPFLLKWLPGGAFGPLSLVPEVILFFAAASALLRPSKHVGDVGGGQRWVLWIGGFLAVGLVSAWVADVAAIDAIYWLRTNVRYMSAALIVGALGDRRWWLRSVAPVIAWGVIVQCAVALIEFVGGASARLFFAPANVILGGRAFVDYATTGPAGISGTLGFYNNFGLYSALATAVCAGALLSISDDDSFDPDWIAGKTRLFGVAVWAGTLNVLLSASRQSFLVFFAAAVAMLIVVGPRTVGRRMIPVIGFAVLFALATFLLPSLTGPLAWIPERFGQVVGGRAVAQSLQTDRLFAIVRVVPAVLLLSPVLGLGPGALSSLSGVGTAAGSLSLSSEGVSYVQDVGWAGIMVQSGLAGFGMFVVLYWWLARSARRLYRSGVLDRGAGGMLAAAFTIWATGMVASSPQLVRSTSLILWCVMGLCIGGYRDAELNEEAVP